MDYISIIIQGIIQGLTEFLPVSSSGHLSVAQHFMNIGENTLITSVVLHLGTLLAVFIAFFPTIWGMIKEFFLTIKDIFTGKFSWKNMNANRRMMFMVIISTAMLVPVYFFKDFFTGFEGDNDIIFEGFAFIFTAILLFMSDKCIKGNAVRGSVSRCITFRLYNRRRPFLRTYKGNCGHILVYTRYPRNSRRKCA